MLKPTANGFSNWRYQFDTKCPQYYNLRTQEHRKPCVPQLKQYDFLVPKELLSLHILATRICNVSIMNFITDTRNSSLFFFFMIKGCTNSAGYWRHCYTFNHVLSFVSNYFSNTLLHSGTSTINVLSAISTNFSKRLEKTKSDYLFANHLLLPFQTCVFTIFTSTLI